MVRQAGSVCGYDDLSDELCREKLIFGLNEDTVRTELLKAHIKPDNSEKSLSDVVSEARAIQLQSRQTSKSQTRQKESTKMSTWDASDAARWNFEGNLVHVFGAVICVDQIHGNYVQLMERAVPVVVATTILPVST